VISHGNTYLEGEKYPTAAFVIPLIFSLEEHFTITKEEYPMLRRLCDLRLSLIKKKFENFMDITAHPQFYKTYLMCGLLHPSKSLEFNGKLFEEGKRLLYDFIKQEVVEGLCLMTVSNSDEEEAPIPNNTSPKTCKGNILFLPIFQFLNVCLSIFLEHTIPGKTNNIYQCQTYVYFGSVCIG
jgi:hypothetical protein